jgi:filamentous hemagglutinin family protein
MKPAARLCVHAPFRRAKRHLHKAVIAALASMQCVAFANPVGEHVVAGSAAIQRSGNTLTVTQGTPRAVINWQGFSIGAGEVTKFVQPGAGSATLNRVTSGNPSVLLGRLEANGQVFVINPNGILVGAGAVINTNAFIASTLNVPNTQFLAGGELDFTGSSTAGIRNFGTIKAAGGDVFLIAHSVQNAGAIEARQGVVGLAAANDVILRHTGDERLFVRSTVMPTPGATGVENSGVMSAVQAELRAAGGNVYALAVNNTGTVHAQGITELDGRILLVSAGGNVANRGELIARNVNKDGGAARLSAGGHALVVNSGLIDASGPTAGAKGGSVTIDGEQVQLLGSAVVTVSGDAGGGTALIGGGFQGRDVQVSNAQRTLVGDQTRIEADALSTGDGGSVIVWADDATRFSGRISARGGAEGGNGGFVEVSGKNALAFQGKVDLGARHGTRGTLLLDPKNLRVQAGGTAAAADVDNFSDDPAADSTVDPLTLAAANANIQLQANNDITFASPIALNVGRSLTATAGRSIIVDASISTQSAAVSLTANESVANGVIDAHRDAGSASIVMAPAAVITSGGGDVRLTVGSGSGLTFNQSGDIAVSRINAGGGAISLVNQGTGNGGIRQQGGPVQASRLALDARGAIVLDDINNNVGTLTVSNGAAVSYVNASGLTVGEAGAGTPVMNVGAVDVSIRTLTGDLNVASEVTALSGATGTLSFDAGGNLLVSESIGGVISRDTSLVFKGGNNVTVAGENVFARNLTATATNGSVAVTRSTPQLVAISDGAPNGAVLLTAAAGVTTGATTELRGRALAVNVSSGDGAFGGITAFNTLSANVGGNLSMTRTENGFDELSTITTGGNLSIKDTVDQNGLRIVGAVQSTGGNVTIGTSGNALFRPGGRIVVGSSGSMDFRTTSGQILDDGTDMPSFIGGTLALVGNSIGGGTSNPLNTEVSRLEAAGGFMFIQNTGPLAIGGAAADLSGLVFTGRDATGTGVFLRNDQTISVVTAGDNILGFGPGIGSINVAATRADADIISTEVITGLLVTLNAGRDIALGNGAAAREALVRGAGVNLIAGRSILIGGPAHIVSASAAPIIATAGQSIIVSPPATQSESTAPQFLSGGNVNLVAQTGVIDLNNGAASRPVIRVNESGGTAKIDLAANEMNLASRLDAGVAGPVFLRQASASQPVSVGFEAAGTLSISDSELDRIAAGTVTIGVATHPGSITVDGGISRPRSGPTYSALALATDGSMFVNGNVDLGTAALTLRSRGTISAFADIAAGALDATSVAGSALLNGALTLDSFAASAINGNVSASNNSNSIGQLGAVLYNNAFNLKDSAGGLRTTGIIDGGASSNATIEVRGGRLVLDSGTKIFFSGAGNELRLFSDTGFTNNVDASVLVPENGARWLIYSPSAAVTTLNGLSGFTVDGVTFPAPPPAGNTGNGVLFASSTGGGTSAGGATSGVTAPPGTSGTASTGADELSDQQQFVFRPVVTAFQGFDVTLRSASDTLRRMAAYDLDRLPADSARFNEFINAMTAASTALASQRQRLEALIANEELKRIMLPEQVEFLGRRITDIDTAVKKVSTAFTAFFTGARTANSLRATTLNALSDPLALLGEINRIEYMYEDQVAREARLEQARLQRVAEAEAKAARERAAALAQQRAQEVLAKAEQAAGKSVVLRDGRRIFVPSGFETAGTTFDAQGRPFTQLGGIAGAMAVGLGQPLGMNERKAIAASAGNLSLEEVSNIVDAGGGYLTPGVIAAIISGGAGNLTANQISAIISGGGGNLAGGNLRPDTQFAIISAGIISGGGGNIISGGAGNLIGQDGAGIISGGAGNFTTEMVSRITGGRISAENVAAIISGGAGNLIRVDAAGIISGGAGNLIGQDGAGIISGGGGNLLGQDGAGIISGGAGNLQLISAGIVAGAARPGEIASIISGGAGNFASLAAMAGIISNDGASIIGQDGAGILADQGSGFAQNAANFSSQAAGLVNQQQARILADQGSGLTGPAGGGSISGNAGALSAGSNFVTK